MLILTTKKNNYTEEIKNIETFLKHLYAFITQLIF